MNNTNEPIYDARKLGLPKMLILGIQHMFAMFGATVLVPIIVAGYFKEACGETLTRGLTVSITLFCVGVGTLIFHLCSKFKVPAFLGSSFAFLGGFYTVANLKTGIYENMSANDKAAYACGGIIEQQPSIVAFCKESANSVKGNFNMKKIAEVGVTVQQE